MTETTKTKIDVGVASGSVLGYFKAIPWPEIAAFLACIYTVIRIYQILKKKKK